MPKRTEVKRKIKVIDGLEYEECGPYCQLCGAHIGKYYNGDVEWGKKILNPHGYESYSSNKCHNCGMDYYYDEFIVMDLTEEDLEAIRRVRGVEKAKR